MLSLPTHYGEERREELILAFGVILNKCFKKSSDSPPSNEEHSLCHHHLSAEDEIKSQLRQVNREYRSRP